MIRAIFYSHDGKLQTDLDKMEIAFLLQELNGLLWVDFQGNPPEEDEPVLSKTFGFHPLAVDDALDEVHVPKVDNWGRYLYIVLHSVAYAQQAHSGLESKELDIFLGENYLVTHHDKEIEAVERVWESAQRNPQNLQKGADHLLYRLADELVDSYMPVVDRLDQSIDQVEAQLFDHPRRDTLEQIYSLKRAALQLRRAIDPQREVLNKLARDEYPVIDDQARVYFRDIYDHMVRLHDIAESVRDLVTDTLDTYLSVVNNRMNEVMKTLTIITTLFMPITFVAGFFGMNFFLPDIPISAWMEQHIFLIVLGLLVVLPSTMFLWIRRRGWM